MQRIADAAQLDDVLASDLAVIFKHSYRCGISSVALLQVRRALKKNLAAPVYLVDVVADSPLSQQIVKVTAVRHESPQAILIRNGRAVWSASHGGVTSGALHNAVDSATGGETDTKV